MALSGGSPPKQMCPFGKPTPFLLSPVLKGAAIASVERLEGGLVNTLYRITPADGGPALCLRVFAAGEFALETERKILSRVSVSLPVPDVLLAGGTLPEDWLRTVRLVDSTRLVEILNGERELPIVFAECRDLIEAVIAEGV